MEEIIVIKAELDASSMGTDRNHYVFPKGFDSGFARAVCPEITGGVYIKKTTPVPNRIIIEFREEKKKDVADKKQE